MRAGYPLSEHLRHTVSYTLKHDEVSDFAADTSRFIREQEPEALTSAVAHRLTYDLRDSRIDPTEGYYVRFGQEVAGLGGDTKYLKHTLTYGHFFPIVDGWVLSGVLRSGHIVGIDDDVRIADRFFLGGRTLRGFEPSGAGPRDKETDDSLGGNLFYSVSGELGFRWAWPTSSTCGAPFSPTSAASPRSTFPGTSSWTSPRPRLSVGVGLNFRSPIGPIRLTSHKP